MGLDFIPSHTQKMWLVRLPILIRVYTGSNILIGNVGNCRFQSQTYKAVLFLFLNNAGEKITLKLYREIIG
jgi:hypothetical protein